MLSPTDSTFTPKRAGSSPPNRSPKILEAKTLLVEIARALDEPKIVRLVTIAVLTKASLMAAVLWGVLHSGLSPFAQALIVAAVSAILTGIFVILAAVITVRLAKPSHETLEKMGSDVADVKASVGATKRKTDKP